MHQRLQEAYIALMVKAPGAAFQRARSLYLNKYPLPQPDQSHGLRLFVAEEQLVEGIDAAPDGNPNHRLATLTSRSKVLAIVHWQQPQPPRQEQLQAYFAETWSINAEQLSLETLPEPWFRNGGYQTLWRLSENLIWQQHSLLTLKE